MEIPILLEPLADGRYLARAGDPFGLVVEASNRQEALTQLQLLIKRKFDAGAELLTMPLSPLQGQALPGRSSRTILCSMSGWS